MSGLLPTGTVTLLLADVEGSTRLWETEPDDMAAAVARLDRAVSDIVSVHDGVRPVEQGEGDSFVVAFARASDAVACALELQRAPLAPIRLRIGVHTGEIQLRDEGNYIGPTINRAARLRDLAHGGQTVLSGATEDLVFDRLPDGVWLTDLGSHVLRDVSRPERVVQLCHPDLRNEFPPLRTTSATGVSNLPAQLTSFVGRDVQLTDMRKLLSDSRLVTLTGAGGAGKTRLAIQVAAHIAAQFRDGVAYVDLAPVSHPAVVPIAVARALGLPDQPGRSTREALVRFVGDRRMLIVLDNCEHLLDAIASLTVELLGACPELTLLTTSREPIGVPGEVTYLVPSLSLADEAVELFTDRARRVRSDFKVTDDNITALTEICRRLDGMPLAIELAAARVRALSLDEIVAGLHDRFRLLTGGSRTAVRRQQTLRASVDWSHALLTEPERVLFRRLAVFLGGFDLDAAQNVAAGADVERYQVLDQISLLVDKSLVVAEDTGVTTRYRLLETVRQYALEKLGESGEADDVRGRHRDHYTAMAALLDAPARTGHEQRIEQAELEMDNLTGAFGWSLETGDIGRALELASSLQPLWLSRGRIQEGLAWLDTALAAEDAAGSDVSRAARVRALADKATLVTWNGTYGGTAEAEQALTMAREIDDPTLLIRALMAQGTASPHHAELSGSCFAEAARLARELGDSWRLSQILGRQAMAAQVAGDPIAGDMAAEEGLQVAETIGDRFASRQCRFAQAWARLCRGELARAALQVRELVDETTAAHDGLLRVYTLNMQSSVLAFSGDPDGAQAAADASLGGCAELGEAPEGVCYTGLGIAGMAAGDAAAARQAYEASHQRFGLQAGAGGLYCFAALAPLACGDLVVARRWADDAVSTTTLAYLSAALMTRAFVEIAQGESESAERDAHEALRIAAGLGGRIVLPEIFECLAVVACESGGHPDAARLLGAAAAARQSMGSVRFKILDAGVDDLIPRLRDEMGENDFDAAWAEGSALSTEEAIAYAQRGRGERKRPNSGWASLTPTELDVVRLVSEGLGNKDVATRLFISPRTVQTHLTHVYTKLGLTSRVQLAQEATRHS